MIVDITDLDKEQKAALNKIGQLLTDLGLDLKNCSEKGALQKNDIWAVRTTIDSLDEIYDELDEENQSLFDFLQDGPTAKLKKV